MLLFISIVLNSEKKYWGLEAVWANNINYYGKMIIIKEGEATPYLYHKKCDKTIFILQGIVNFTIENITKTLNEGESYHILPKMMYKLHAIRGDATVLEAGINYSDNDHVFVDRQ